VVGTSSKKIAVIAALSTLMPNSALPQQTGGVGATGTTAQTTTGAPPVAQPLASGGTSVQATTGLQNTGGLQVDFGVSSKLTFDDNFKLSNKSGGTSSIWDNTLTFGLSNITPTQNLSLTASTVARLAHIPGRSIRGFEDPTVRLKYTLDGVNSNFTLDGFYRHADREFLNPFQVEQEEQALGQLIGGGGTVTWKNIGGTFQTGINDPLGFQLALKHSDQSYDALAQSVNPLLFDRTTDTANATVTLKVSPIAQVRGSVGLTDYDAQDVPSTHRKTLDYAIGATLDINPVLQLDGQIGYTDVTTDTTTGRTTRSGATSAVTLTQTLPNGTVYGSFISTVNQNGTRSVFSFGRDFLLPNGTFTGNLGMTHTPAGNNHLSGALAYNRTMRSSDITVTAARAVSTNGANQDILNTRLGVSYNYAINNDSTLNLALNWGRSEAADNVPGFNTTDRTTFTAAYSQALTQDWNATGGLQMRHRSDNTGNAHSNAIFVTLDRKFSYRP
jgi:hypothetical protein